MSGHGYQHTLQSNLVKLLINKKNLFQSILTCYPVFAQRYSGIVLLPVLLTVLSVVNVIVQDSGVHQRGFSNVSESSFLEKPSVQTSAFSWQLCFLLSFSKNSYFKFNLPYLFQIFQICHGYQTLNSGQMLCVFFHITLLKYDTGIENVILDMKSSA